MEITIKPIAHIENGYMQKFGIPRQAALVKNAVSKIIFEPEFRNPDCIRGIENCSHIWLIWQFSEFANKQWSPLVRPPRLGGNKKMGVFATRSPLRPNSLALSAVKILQIKLDNHLGAVIEVLGADLMNGTPIYDIKPYVPYADCIENATSKIFVTPKTLFDVKIECEIPNDLTATNLNIIKEVLLQDPRPAYKNDGKEIFAFEYYNFHIEFYVENQIVVVTKLSS